MLAHNPSHKALTHTLAHLFHTAWPPPMVVGASQNLKEGHLFLKHTNHCAQRLPHQGVHCLSLILQPQPQWVPACSQFPCCLSSIRSGSQGLRAPGPQEELSAQVPSGPSGPP